MSRTFRALFAKVFMTVRECMVRDRRPEINEEAVADLYSCLQQLSQRANVLEAKITNATQDAVRHKVLSGRERTASGKQRELNHARRHLEDRRRLQADLDRTLHFSHMLRQQIETIVSGHLDGVVIEAMRGYNSSAARLGLPDKSKDVENLVQELEERSKETQQLQEAIDQANEKMREIGASSSGAAEGRAGFSEDDIMLELETLLLDDADVQDLQQPKPQPSPQPAPQPAMDLPSPPRAARVMPRIVELHQHDFDPPEGSELRLRPPTALTMPS